MIVSEAFKQLKTVTNQQLRESVPLLKYKLFYVQLLFYLP